MTVRKVFRYQKITIQVTTAARDDLLWLEEFLSPQFSLPRRAEPDCAVVMRQCPDSYRELIDRGPSADLEPRDGFAQDTKTDRFAIYAKTGDGWTAFDRGLEVFYVTDHRAREVTIIHSGSDCRRARFSLMRVVRELAMTHMVRLGQPILHASAFANAHCGFAISGPKKAGKTSLLIHSLQRGDLKYLANDRVFAGVGRSRTDIHGLPTILTLREAALLHYPRLNEQIRAGGYAHTLTLAEAHRQVLGPSQVDMYGRFNLTPRHFCDLLKVRAQASAPLAAFLFPTIDPHADRIEVRKLDPAENLVRIRNGLFRAGHSRQTHDFFALLEVADDRLGGRLQQATDELAARVPGFECRIGPNAYGDYHWLEAIERHTRAP